MIADGVKEKATALLSSMRGQYVMSQALDIAVQELKKETDPALRKSDNIQDMELLIDGLFPMARDIRLMQMNKQNKAE